jgi:hypothetical protein
MESGSPSPEGEILYTYLCLSFLSNFSQYSFVVSTKEVLIQSSGDLGDFASFIAHMKIIAIVPSIRYISAVMLGAGIQWGEAYDFIENMDGL